jgi:hypothetical protein
LLACHSLQISGSWQQSTNKDSMLLRYVLKIAEVAGGCSDDMYGKITTGRFIKD